jgi:hypothetical protein
MTEFADIGGAILLYASAAATLRQHVAAADLCTTGRRVAAEGLRLLAHARGKRDAGFLKLRIEDEPARRAA